MFSDHNGIKIEISKRKLTEKSINTYKINYTLLNNPCIKNEVSRELKTHMKENGEENTIYQSMWNTAKAVLRGKPVALNMYVRKEEESQVNKLLPWNLEI